MGSYQALALFAGGVLFGSAGIKLLSSKDAKKAYIHTTAAALRMKDCVMETATTIQENAADILAQRQGSQRGPGRPGGPGGRGREHRPGKYLTRKITFLSFIYKETAEGAVALSVSLSRWRCSYEVSNRPRFPWASPGPGRGSPG